MRRRRVRTIVIGLLLFVVGRDPAGAQQPMIDPQAWQAYKAKFLDPGGRIIDDGNGGISHSEGQGYGLLLAYLANNPADFEQIWYFTRTELLIRDDGLAAWSWNPGKTPHIEDINNASDGDILIAYALALAGSAWQKGDYTSEATKIAQALLTETTIAYQGEMLLLPGASGFSEGDREDGPVVNPSYWIFEAFPVLGTLVPSDKWQKMLDSGVALLRQMQFGAKKLPADWVSLKRRPQPAAGFPPEFGYNAVRIPLYLVRGGIKDAALLTRLKQGMSDANGSVTLIDLSSDKVTATLSDPGYQVINDLVDCVVDGTKLPATARQFVPTLYYPSTLHLLGLAYAAEKHPECL
ncbi:glycosyl hydrolase family 8 [Rhizobium tubonense]|uniref:cellulase n=1 Tax=Rhizobium tubonense TaxID=484088 RepID=A0A2W4CQS5_9HYPH|nr:glycosyl hydrolase family 8 [Rhizobium tubonense]PZM14681.1 endoglucanase [Rhizobium tubonense]